MNRMSLKPLTIGIAAAVLALQWPFLQCRRADSKLSEFYAEIASANFGAARDSIDEAIKLWPSNARYYAWRGYCKSQSFPPQCPRNRYTDKGQQALDRDLVQDAIEDYRHALALNPRDAVAHHDLAWLDHLLGDDAAAEADWQEATNLDPDNAVFHLSFGMYLEEDGKGAAAREQYARAIVQSPSILDSQFFLRYRTRSSQTADAMVAEVTENLASKLQHQNDPILEGRLGKLCLYGGNLDRAKELLEDAVQQLPNLPLVWFNLGEVHRLQGDPSEATLCYRRATTIDSSLAQAYLRLGELELEAWHKNAAFQDLNVAVQKWQRVNPITAAHNNRLYGGPTQTIDDLLPTTLVWYVSPCEVSAAWTALSRLFPERQEYARRSRTCETLPGPHKFLDVD